VKIPTPSSPAAVSLPCLRKAFSSGLGACAKPPATFEQKLRNLRGLLPAFSRTQAHRQPPPRLAIPLFALGRHPLLSLSFRHFIFELQEPPIVVGDSAGPPSRSLSLRESWDSRDLSKNPDLALQISPSLIGLESQDYNLQLHRGRPRPKQLANGQKAFRGHGLHTGSRQTNTFVAKFAISR
jgi:hypothetical protein